MIRISDDVALTVETEEELDNTLTKMKDSCKEYIMKIKKNKTKILVYSKQLLSLNTIIIESEKLETVRYFTYLESKITNDEKARRT